MKQKNFFMMLVLAFGVTTFMTAQVPSYVPTNGLVGYWPFNGNANDMSTNANNGTNNGASLTTDRFGMANSAYSFDGTTNHISVNNSASINPTSISISGWFNTNELPLNSGDKANSLISKWAGRYNCNNDGDNYTIQLSKPANTSVLIGATSMNNFSANAINSSNYQLTTSKWIHFVYIHNQNTGESLYLDGQLVSQNNITGALCSTNNDLHFGADIYQGVFNRHFNGKIDDIGIWNRALTEQEISNLYNANICYQSVTVTDTLIINTGILGYNPITYDNAITMYPNPAKDHLTIDCGTLAKVTGYQIKVTNALGQEVFKTTLNQQQITTPLNAWGGTGMYFVNVYNAQGQQIEVRKIILQ